VQDYTILHFTPFDPVSKRTVAKVRDKDGNVFRVAKGAPQVILGMAHNAADLRPTIKAKIDEFAGRGYRALGLS
jgi:H+-transporting ATPase